MNLKQSEQCHSEGDQGGNPNLQRHGRMHDLSHPNSYPNRRDNKAGCVTFASLSIFCKNFW